MHTLALRVDENISKALPAIHFLTGSDVTSKVGTKPAALKVKPEYIQGLATFGENLSDENCSKAEVFLVQVLKSGSKCMTMNKFRNWMYHHSKSAQISSLPPTSHLLTDHIKRAHLATYQVQHVLDEEAVTLDPLQYGYIKDPTNDSLIPKQDIRIWPEDLIKQCTCKTCSQASCGCKQSGQHCISFCKCTSLQTNKCKNPFLKESELLEAMLN
ncbi:unnamed protein product [Owenia fusiformis]|uniref:Tesmin/TSO1-like CXC domain-containing protein n=1 Tax=Owenia fusiformis TaxID=6347 RepID=A0A8S4PNR9_OWEFU|nr:unnamed protein product [Owenia fusiformis]